MTTATDTERPTFCQTVASNTREAQKSASVTTSELARRVEMPRTTLRRRLNDGNFIITDLFRVAWALGVSPVELVGGWVRGADGVKHFSTA